MTSCALAMAHGSNDIANAAGPLTAIVFLFRSAEIPEDGSLFWVTLVTACGLVVGLAVLGYRVMQTIGDKITKLTSSRAFVVQFATAFIILAFSNFGIPLSTTHVVVGAVMGISFCDMKHIREIQWEVFAKIIWSWVITIPCAGFVAMGTFAIFKVMNQAN